VITRTRVIKQRSSNLHRSTPAAPRMEPLWSPVVATGGSQRQIRSARNPPKQAKSVATGCHRLLEKFHGKQGVCRGLPPVAGGPLPVKEGVDVLLGSTVRGYFLLQSGHGH
jgi:hypothetical protein